MDEKNIQLKAFLKAFLICLSRYELVNGSGRISGKLDELVQRLDNVPDELSYRDIDALASEVRDLYM